MKKRLKKIRKNIHYSMICDDVIGYIFGFLDCKTQLLLSSKVCFLPYIKFNVNIFLKDLSPECDLTINYLLISPLSSRKAAKFKVKNAKFKNMEYDGKLFHKGFPNHLSFSSIIQVKYDHTIGNVKKITLKRTSFKKVSCSFLILKELDKMINIDYNSLKRLHLISCDFDISKLILMEKGLDELLIKTPLKELILPNVKVKSLKLINCGEFFLSANIMVDNLYLTNSYNCGTNLSSITQKEVKCIKITETLMINNVNIGFYNITSLFTNNAKYLILEHIDSNFLNDLISLSIDCMVNLKEIKIILDNKKQQQEMEKNIPKGITIEYY